MATTTMSARILRWLKRAGIVLGGLMATSLIVGIGNEQFARYCAAHDYPPLFSPR